MAEFVHVYNDGGGIRNVPMREGATRLTTDRVLYQSGVAFWLPPGDGGANGLNFTGTNGEFTLSAAVVSGFWNLLSAGGYAYFPAGAGGLASGWYWCKMTSETAGEVFTETYSGSGKPVFVSSPTANANLTSGRITQSTAEISAFTFVLPGGSMGPNGLIKMTTSLFGDITGAKTYRFRSSQGNAVIAQAGTSTSSVGDHQFIIRNRGVETAQFGPRSGLYTVHATIGGSWQYTTLDNKVDQTITASLQTTSPGSGLISGLDVNVMYGV